MKRLVQRGLVLLGASAIAVGLAVPAHAGTRHPAPEDTIAQRQAAEVSNQTKQTSVAIAPAIQVAPATNIGVLTFGGQSIKQANNNQADATAANLNITDQLLSQSQLGNG
jgi:hypothetical protein